MGKVSRGDLHTILRLCRAFELWCCQINFEFETGQHWNMVVGSCGAKMQNTGVGNATSCMCSRDGVC